MIKLTLIDKSRLDIKLGGYFVGSATQLSDPSLLPLAQEYRRKLSAQMMPLDKPGIRQKIPSSDYHASRKVDGEFTLLVFRDEEVFTINPGGTIRMGMPWQNEIRKQLLQANVSDAVIVGELYARSTDRRPRIHDVVTIARQPQSAADLERLGFAVFDIISLDGEPAGERFRDTWKLIEKVFGDGTLVHPVDAKFVKDSSEVESLFEQWVEAEGAEGLVVRSDETGMYKIKLRHTLDAVVIGFTESSDDRQGMMHDLLLAVMRADGTFQVLSRVGGGFSDQQRRDMLSDLKDMVVDSEYAEVNSDYVAYNMVRPDWVVEVDCLDLISHNTRGGNISRMVLDYQCEGKPGYKVVRRLPLATVISPQFVRRREDKRAHPADVRIAQVSDRVEVPQVDVEARQFQAPKSTLMRREVYTKQLKGETLVRKFVLLKTNKETASDEHPAYVIHYTDFSPGRKDALSREVLVSNSHDQIASLFEQMKEENVKKGWTAYQPAATSVAEPIQAIDASLPPPVSAVDSPSIAEEPKTKKRASRKNSAEAAPEAVEKSEPIPPDNPVAPKAARKKKA